MRTPFAAVALLAAAISPGAIDARPAGLVRVRLETSDGAIVLALDARHAPKTTANFLAYVDDGRFDGTWVYRAMRSKSQPGRGFIQGGIGMDARRILPPFAHEPTTRTGLRHVDGTISMARAGSGSAGGNYFIAVGPLPAMDARGAYQGYAAFGQVIAGMATVKRILAEPTGGGREAMRGQMILKPVRVIRAVRLDGVAQPTAGPKPWLMGVRGR